MTNELWRNYVKCFDANFERLIDEEDTKCNLIWIGKMRITFMESTII